MKIGRVGPNTRKRACGIGFTSSQIVSAEAVQFLLLLDWNPKVFVLTALSARQDQSNDLCPGHILTFVNRRSVQSALCKIRCVQRICPYYIQRKQSKNEKSLVDRKSTRLNSIQIPL